MVIHEQSGLLVSPSSPEELAGALYRILTSPEDRESFGEAGRMIVESRFTVRNKLENTEQHYNLLLSQG